jgi:hypothetical protein
MFGFVRVQFCLKPREGKSTKNESIIIKSIKLSSMFLINLHVWKKGNFEVLHEISLDVFIIYKIR